MTKSLHPGVAELIAADGQLLEVRESAEAFQAHVCDHGGANIYGLQGCDAGDVIEGGIADLCSMHVQALQLFPAFDGGQAFVGDIFGKVEIQIDDARGVLELLHSLVGDARQGQVQVREIGKLQQPAKIGIGDPGGAQINTGDLSGGVASDGAAQGFDPFHSAGSFRFRRGEVCGEPQQACQRGFHLICSFDAEAPNHGRIPPRKMAASF